MSTSECLKIITAAISMALAVPIFAADSGIPPVSLQEAVSLAKDFVRTNSIDISHHQASGGTLGRYTGGPNYWDIRYSPTNKTAKTHNIDLRVDMDKTVTYIAHAEDLSVFIAVPVLAPGNERSVVAFDRNNSHFAVILSNTSRESLRIATQWNSWGYESLHFEVVDKTGRKSVARRVAVDFQKNMLNWWVLEPNENVILDVYFADPQKWEGFPSFTRYGESETVTLRAFFEFAPAERKPSPEGLWTGRVVSKPEQIVFYNRIPDKK